MLMVLVFKHHQILIIAAIMFFGLLICFNQTQTQTQTQSDESDQKPNNNVQILRIPIEDRVDLSIDDDHNVHNNCLKRHVQKIIKKLQQTDQSKFTVASTIKGILLLIKKYWNKQSQICKMASIALIMINQMDATYDLVKLPEREILRLIWERIHHPINKSVQENLEQCLIEQLADCLSSPSELHCCEGRIMRLIQTFECIDHDDIVQMKPMWAFKEEISQSICRYRQKMLDKESSYIKELDSKPILSDQDRNLLNQFNQRLINKLNRKFIKDYVSVGLLTMEELDDLTKIYYDSLYDF